MSKLDRLYKQVVQGDPRAGAELSAIAGLGGSPKARELVDLLDANPPNYHSREAGKARRSLLGDIAFSVAHPRSAMRAIRRQVAVSFDLGVPPHTSNTEDFPRLSLRKAVGAIRRAEEQTRKE